MSRPRQCHSVVQMVLRRFADSDGRLYFFDRRAVNWKPARRIAGRSREMVMR